MKLSSRFTRAAVAAGTALALSTGVVAAPTALADETGVSDALAGSAGLGSAGVGSVAYLGLWGVSLTISILFWVGVYNLAVLNGMIPNAQTVKVPIQGYPQ